MASSKTAAASWKTKTTTDEEKEREHDPDPITHTSRSFWTAAAAWTTLWSDTIGGLNTFIAEQKLVSGTADFSLAAFDHEYVDIMRGVPLTMVDKIDGSKFPPRGNTSLLDAIGRAIVELGEDLAKQSEDQRPSTVIVLIQTDGHENSSQEFKGATGRAAIKALIDKQTTQYKWKFIFAAAQLESIHLANSIGIATSREDHYKPTRGGTEALYSSLSGQTRSARAA